MNPPDAFQDLIYWLIPGITAIGVLATFQFKWLGLNGASISRSALVSCGVLSLITLVQWVSEGFAVQWNLAATLGNKNFLSESLVLLIGLAAPGLFSNSWHERRITQAVLAVTLATIFILKSTAALLGILVIAIPIIRQAYRQWSSDRSMRARVGLVLLFTVSGLGLGAAFFSKLSSTGINDLFTKGQQYQHSEHYATANSTGYSTGERLLLWKNSISLLQSDRWLGHGGGNWKILWPSPGIEGPRYIESGVMHYEHPHNEPLLMLTENGIVGLILWLTWLLLIPISAGIRKEMSNTGNGMITRTSAFSLLAFFLLCNLSYPAHRVFSATLAGIHIALLLPVGQHNHRSRFGISRWIYGILLVVSLCLLRFGYLRMRSDSRLSAGLSMQAAGNFQGMLRALSGCDKTVYPLDHTGTPVSWYQGFAHFYSGRSDSALWYFRDAEKRNPFHVQILSDMGACYLNAGQPDSGEVYIARALQIIPDYQEALFNYSVIAYQRRQWQTTLSRFKRVRAENPAQLTALNAFLFAYLDSALGKNSSFLPANDTFPDRKSLADVYRLAGHQEAGFVDSVRVRLISNRSSFTP